MSYEHITLRFCLQTYVLFLFMQNARPPLPESCPNAFRQLITRCWASKPEKRPGFDEIVRILERYASYVEEDPEFLKWYDPGNGSLFGCDRGCFGPLKTGSRKSVTQRELIMDYAKSV